MDLQNLIETLLSSGSVEEVSTNVRAQFGPPTRRYLGATLLPERLVDDLAYEEREIRFRTVIANDGSRYAPAQLKDSGSMVGKFNVSLGHSDIARQFTARDYDGLVQMLGRNRSMEAQFRILGWLDAAVNLALVELNEKQRWDALLNALVVRKGDNGYGENVYYPVTPGQRVTAGGAWSDPTYDPWLDITAMAQKLYDKGYQVNRIITSRYVLSLLSGNPKMAQRILAMPVVLSGGSLTAIAPGRRMTLEQLNGAMASEGLPPFETYDLTYNTQVGTFRFFDRATMLMVATTGRNEEIMVDPITEPILVQDTLGYEAIGPAAGQSGPGRVIHVEAFTNKPPRIEAEAWQASLPVILDPAAIATISSIT